jgi:hypothetical protein
MEKTMTLTLTDDELRLLVKSLSITSDSLSAKLDRLKGQRRNDAKAEYALCDRVLTKAKQEQTARIMGDPTERTG